ncbi:MAG: hypothetical protein AB1813_12970 [Verrucomicrobiota bacterium]
MKDPATIWTWLTRAAHHAPAPTSKIETLPFGFETRVIAEWKSRSADELIGWDSLVRGAVLCSSLILLLCMAATYWSANREQSAEADLTETIIEMTLNR